MAPVNFWVKPSAIAKWDVFAKLRAKIAFAAIRGGRFVVVVTGSANHSARELPRISDPRSGNSARKPPGPVDYRDR